MMKRVTDIVAAGVLLAFLWPVLVVVALAIRLRLGSPVLFRQQRPGYRGAPFMLYKFRTMTDDRDATGALLPDHERLPPLGAFIRSTSLDELPQLLNVLRGELSLVGPRPLLMEYLPLYTPEQMRRHDVRPGITGWAQVNGRNTISWPEKFALDVWYVDHQSWWLDLRILGLTVLKVLRKDAVSADGHVTMPRFTGETATGGPGPSSVARGPDPVVSDGTVRDTTPPVAGSARVGPGPVPEESHE